MKPRFFQYVSRSKVEMLFEQFQSNNPKLSELAPKVNFYGFEISIGLKRDSESTDSLIPRTLKLLEQMRKQRLLVPLSPIKSELQITHYYKDTSSWHSGLVMWDYRSRQANDPYRRVVVYFVFKAIGDSLILLMGSPSHLIGGKDIDQTLYPLPSAGPFDHYLRKHMETYLGSEGDQRFDLNDPYQVSLPLGEEAEEALYSLALGTFCLEEARRLPKTQLETVFKIYRHYRLRKNMAVAAKGKIINSMLARARDVGVAQFKHLYIGSPLYTALL